MGVGGVRILTIFKGWGGGRERALAPLGGACAGGNQRALAPLGAHAQGGDPTTPTTARSGGIAEEGREDEGSGRAEPKAERVPTGRPDGWDSDERWRRGSGRREAEGRPRSASGRRRPKAARPRGATKGQHQRGAGEEAKPRSRSRRGAAPRSEGKPATAPPRGAEWEATPTTLTWVWGKARTVSRRRTERVRGKGDNVGIFYGPVRTEASMADGRKDFGRTAEQRGGNAERRATA